MGHSADVWVDGPQKLNMLCNSNLLHVIYGIQSVDQIVWRYVLDFYNYNYIIFKINYK